MEPEAVWLGPRDGPGGPGSIGAEETEAGAGGE